MMKAIVHYYDTAKKAIQEMSGDNKLTFAVIEKTTFTEINALSKWKFENPETSQEEMNKKNEKLVNDINMGFKKLTDK